MKDILERINFLYEDEISELRKKRAISLGLTHQSFGRYKDKKGETFTWDKVKNDFVGAGGKVAGDKVVDPNEKDNKIRVATLYFINHFNMKSVGHGLLADRFGNRWTINIEKRSLDKTKSIENNK